MGAEGVEAVGKPLANIARVEIEVDDGLDGLIVHRMTDVATEAESIAYVSEGEEKTLRVKNKIIAQNNTEDILLGYDIKLVNVKLIPEIFAIIDGGEVSEDGSYEGPEVGKVVERTPFKLRLYTEEKDVNGDILSYVKVEFPSCKGKPVNFSMQDGEFFLPEYTSKSRPASGEKPIKLSSVDELPA